LSKGLEQKPQVGKEGLDFVAVGISKTCIQLAIEIASRGIPLMKSDVIETGER